MQLPVNVGDVLKIATDMKEVSSTPISVSIYIDDTAPGALVGHVRSAFASSSEHTRVTIEYIDDDPVNMKKGEDIGVFVAGTSQIVGREAERLREAGIPAMIVTDDPEQAESISKETGHPIPAGDIVAPVRLDSKLATSIAAKLPFGLGNKIMAKSRRGSEVEATGNDASVGSVTLDEEAFKVLAARMGKWIVAACKEKELAFALSFPFIRRPLADDSISATSLQNGAVGLVPFLPGADMPIMTLNQIKMVLQIATAYGQPLDKDRIKEVVAVVAGAFLCRNVVRSATKIVPFAGWLISGAMGFAATEAMGKAMIEYLEAGGDMVGVANVLQTARDKAIEVSKEAAASPMGQNIMSKAKSVASDLASKN